MNLKKLPGSYAVVQLASDADLPPWVNGAGFCATVRSEYELAVVCDQTRVPQGITAERDWACFRSVGPFGFDEAGIVAALITPISTAGIGVFVLCTFDGEHIMCPAQHFGRVCDILTAQGHRFTD